ncbi:3'-5' exonuclease [Paracoccus cavernae]|uniref:3'-5' exonuclease n=1 Tax=Paracoccus cavernae TaxID=1571207 RepID=UPI0035F330E7
MAQFPDLFAGPSSGRSASLPLTAALPEETFRFIALDVETSCSDSASICQIGLACVRFDASIVTLSSYLDPEMPFSSFNTRIHGIKAATVRGAPLFGQLFPAILPLLARHPLVQHSSFDRRAILAACAHHGLAAPALDWTDSVTIARRAWPELKGNGGHGLGNLKQVLDLSFDHHDAGEDARAAAMVVLRAEAHLGKAMIPAPSKTGSGAGTATGASGGRTRQFRPSLHSRAMSGAGPLSPARQSD